MKSEYNLDFVKFKEKIEEFSEFNLSDIHITGGNILLHSDFFKILNLLNDFSAVKKYYINYLNFDPVLSTEILHNEKNKLIILVNSPFEIDDLKRILSISQNNITFSFIFSNENEMFDLISLIDELKLGYYNFKPFYHDNIDFFKKYVFISENDILSSKNSKNDILIKKHINQFDYGKLVFYNDGKVYSNLNFKSLGNYEYNIYELIILEITEKNSWFRTRPDLTPCNKCKFKLLCPSPSNYEIIIGQNNLCTQEINIT